MATTPMEAHLAEGSKPSPNMACCASLFHTCVQAGRDPPRPWRNPWEWLRHLVVAFTGVCAVTPLTNVTPASLKYQLYLNTIFHRTPVSFYGHATTMPMVNFFIFVLMSFCEYHPSSGGKKSFGDLSILWAGVLWLWYCLWGVCGGIPWMGPGAAPIVGGMWIAAHYYTETILKLPTDPGFHWYNPGPAAANPLIWMFVASALQATSHFPEHLPPRFNGKNHWMTKTQFWCYDYVNLWDFLFRSLRAFWQQVFGTIDELIASPRLLPLFWSVRLWYNVLKSCGIGKNWESMQFIENMDDSFHRCLVRDAVVVHYRKDPKQLLVPRLWNRYCCVLGQLHDPEEAIPNPALDYVGTGGASTIQADDQGLEWWYCVTCRCWRDDVGTAAENAKRTFTITKFKDERYYEFIRCAPPDAAQEPASPGPAGHDAPSSPGGAPEQEHMQTHLVVT